ncbi:MAG: asparagine synthase (glutamine-hydrolyzing) [Planctomycetes bacterium]|nr:asparagine synthase (glutamine-hydrolyzing) [Planctomycetota bacterium]
MCGIAGIFCRDRAQHVERDLLERMARAIAHRGPDGEGFRVGAGYGLAHRRLSIVDLAGGHQPMADATERYWVSYNGEIYNFAELRAELERAGHRFATRCDTEVLLYGYREWGEALPTRLRGMFAFAIVDVQEHTLFAARDRIGKKPLYYAEVGDEFVFGSEPKAILEHPGVARDLDPVAIRQYFCLRYVADPGTAFRAIRRLPPGHALTVRDGTVRVRRYWQLSFAEPVARPVEELAEEVLERLDEAVRIRLMGDVPLGAFLSGGVDSYAIVDSMRRVGDAQVVACTVGFDDPRYDERGYARASAEACGALLHEERVSAEDMLDQGWYAATFDEPFSDSSAVPTYHVSRLARRHVTVALSGDGGDESFAGYRRYKYDVVENRIRGWAPRFLWRLFGAVYPKADFLPRWLRFKRTFQNLARDPGEAYARSVSCTLPEQLGDILRPELARLDDDPLAPVRDAWSRSDGPDSLARAAATDFETWLPGDILTKVDRASMAVSLEVRAPLLDHELVEAAARIPSTLKLAGGETKALLKRALRPRLGDALDRPKQGFVAPVKEWLRGPLGDELEAVLGDERLASIIDPGSVGRLLRQHRAGLADHTEPLWSTLCLHRFQHRWCP